MKASIAGELLLLVGLLALAYLVYLQQDQLVSLELELDKIRGAYVPVPAAENSSSGEARVQVTRPKAQRPRTPRTPRAPLTPRAPKKAEGGSA